MMYVRYALLLIGKSVIDKRGLYVRNHFVYFKNNWNYSTGSSPRMRGTLSDVGGEVVQLGIIPAHAGNTMSPDIIRRTRWDHPRACGEHSASSCFSRM